jgi:hypothetical protein
VLSALESGRPAGITDLGTALREMVARSPRRGLVILISDLYDDTEALARGLALLRQAGHEVLVFHLLDRDEREFPFHGPLEFVDLETGERMAVQGAEARQAYLREMGRFLTACSDACAAAGAGYLRLDTATSLAAPLAAFLAARSGRQRAGIPWR